MPWLGTVPLFKPKLKMVSLMLGWLPILLRDSSNLYLTAPDRLNYEILLWLPQIGFTLYIFCSTETSNSTLSRVIKLQKHSYVQQKFRRHAPGIIILSKMIGLYFAEFSSLFNIWHDHVPHWFPSWNFTCYRTNVCRQKMLILRMIILMQILR